MRAAKSQAKPYFVLDKAEMISSRWKNIFLTNLILFIVYLIYSQE